jgi:hypothetical protein
MLRDIPDLDKEAKRKALIAEARSGLRGIEITRDKFRVYRPRLRVMSRKNGFSLSLSIEA